jgi:hypothetical protein
MFPFSGWIGPHRLLPQKLGFGWSLVSQTRLRWPVQSRACGKCAWPDIRFKNVSRVRDSSARPASPADDSLELQLLNFVLWELRCCCCVPFTAANAGLCSVALSVGRSAIGEGCRCTADSVRSAACWLMPSTGAGRCWRFWASVLVLLLPGGRRACILAV